MRFAFLLLFSIIKSVTMVHADEAVQVHLLEKAAQKDYSEASGYLNEFAKHEGSSPQVVEGLLGLLSYERSANKRKEDLAVRERAAFLLSQNYINRQALRDRFAQDSQTYTQGAILEASGILKNIFQPVDLVRESLLNIILFPSTSNLQLIDLLTYDKGFYWDDNILGLRTPIVVRLQSQALTEVEQSALVAKIRNAPFAPASIAADILQKQPQLSANLLRPLVQELLYNKAENKGTEDEQIRDRIQNLILTIMGPGGTTLLPEDIQLNLAKLAGQFRGYRVADRVLTVLEAAPSLSQATRIELFGILDSLKGQAATEQNRFFGQRIAMIRKQTAPKGCAGSLSL